MSEKKVDLFMKLWIGDYLADTLNFSTLEHGIYFLLLLHAWRNDGHIPKDKKELKKIAKLFGRGTESALNCALSKFQLGENTYTHKRVIKELQIAKSQSDNRKKIAELGAKARWKNHAESNASSNAESNALAMPAIAIANINNIYNKNNNNKYLKKLTNQEKALLFLEQSKEEQRLKKLKEDKKQNEPT